MQPVYPEDRAAEAYDTSGVPVNPAAEGFQTLGQVYGTSTSNAYTAEQDRELALRQAAQMTAEQRAKVEQRARQYAGMRKVQQAIAGGAKPEEAVWLAADDLFGMNPTALPSLLRSTRTAPQFTPELIEAPGGRIFRSGPNRNQFIKDTPGKMPQENSDERKILSGEITSARSQLDALQKKAGDKAERALNPNIDQQIAELTDRLSKSQSNYMRLGTNWMDRPAAPAAEKAITKEIAAQLLKQAGGDKEKARKLARDAGYKL